MAAQRGIELVLDVDSDGAGTYQRVGGIQTSGYELGTDTVDITSQDDASRWRQLMANAAVKSMSASGNGVFKDDAAIQTIRTYFANGTIRNWKITHPSFCTYIGLFQITRLTVGGDHNREITNAIALESAGDITITPI
jgi:TP901-1 family phage major tail protein